MFKHSHLNRRIDEQALRSGPGPAVAGLHLSCLEKKAVFTGQTHLFAADVEQPGDQPRNTGCVLRAGDAHDRNATVLMNFEQMINDGFANRSRLTARRLQVGQQAGAGIDFNHRAALPRQRERDVLQHHINAGNVQANHARGQCCRLRHAGVHEVRHIQGHVAVALDQHMGASRGHRIGSETLACQFKNDFGGILGLHGVQGGVFASTAPGVDIDVGVDKFNDVG